MEIDPNEKYGMVAIQADLPAGHNFTTRVASNIWVSTKNAVSFDHYWREWLGSIRSEHFKDSNFFIVAKKQSREPDGLDAENQELSDAVLNFYRGLLLAGRFGFFERPLLLTGSRTDKELSVRQIQDIETPINFSGIKWDRINSERLDIAHSVASALPLIWDGPGRYKRLRRILNIYFSARTTADILDRAHQYCRCIEGLIIPAPGDSGRKFKSRTELFIGPNHHVLMAAIYDLRSAIEHLNDHMALISQSREERAQVYRWAHIAEFIIRKCLVRILTRSNLWPLFETDEALKAFWKNDPGQRQLIWGSPLDPMEAVSSFDIRSMSNADFGLT